MVEGEAEGTVGWGGGVNSGWQSSRTGGGSS